MRYLPLWIIAWIHLLPWENPILNIASLQSERLKKIKKSINSCVTKMIYKTDLNAFTTWKFQWKAILLLWNWNNSTAHEVIYWIITCFFTEDSLSHKRSLKYCSFSPLSNKETASTWITVFWVYSMKSKKPLQNL